MSTSCLEENEIVDLVTGNLDAEAAAVAEAHVDGCPSCRLVLIELARVFELRASSLPEVAPEDDSQGITDRGADDGLAELLPAAMARGTSIGRYLVLGTLGAGAMGVVHAAFDPELDRKVALKLLRSRALGEGSSERLVREARATARLAHPNVVVVHDVGLHEGSVFMAMEHVEGGTLGEWLAAKDRSQEEIVAAFHDAGRGLEAAHEAGLVHRDFKPANVLMGRDGRARVTDFGLARQGQTTQDRDALFSTQSGTQTELSDATLTRTGALVGTPAYMSPEQFAGGVADARSDQFSFCVALFEALCGSRPFAGRTVTELAANVNAGRIAERQHLDALPRHLRSALVRGLRADPGERFPTLASLLRAMQPSGWSATRRSTKALFLAGLGIGALGLASAIATSKDDARCTPAAQAIPVAAWNPERADLITVALQAKDTDTSADLVARVRGDLGRFASKWTESRTAACVSSKTAHRNVALQCLDERLVHFEALVDALEESDDNALQYAGEAVGKLGDPVQCNQRDWTRSPPRTPPADQAEPVAAVRRRLARVSADASLGKFETALASVTSLREEAEALGFDPLTAEVLHEVGFLHLRMADYESSLAALEQAFRTAIRCGDTRLMVSTGALALHLLGSSTPNLEQAHLWMEMTHGALEREGLYSRPAASFWNSVGLVERQRGNYDEARKAYKRSYELHQAFEPDGPEALSPLNNLAALEMDVDDYGAAEARSRELFREIERRYGPEHPDYVPTLGTLAAALAAQNKLDEAASSVETALTMGEAWFGRDSPRLDSPRAVLAGILKRKGDLEGSKALYEQLIETWTRTRGPNDPNVSLVHNNLATTLTQMERGEEALAHHIRALEILQVSRDDTHRSVVQGNSAVGTDYMNLGRCDDALRYFEAAAASVDSLAATDVLRSVVNHNRAKYTWVCGGDTKQGQVWVETAVEQAKVSFGKEHAIVGRFALSAAELALDNDDVDAARQHFETKQRLATPKPTDATRARMLYVEARIAQDDGHATQALALLARALPLLPEVTRWIPLRTRILAMQARLTP
ncbi:MAG: tetratricopeptide repeat protein [Nannocystales bacterium]